MCSRSKFNVTSLLLLFMLFLLTMLLFFGTALHFPCQLLFLKSLSFCSGILEGFFHVRQVHWRNKEKNTFLLILRVLGWSKLLDLDWWRRKFPRMDSLARKKIWMLDRTLTTPKMITKIIPNCHVSHLLFVGALLLTET